MKMTYKAFARKLFGVKYERLIRTLFVYVIMYYGLRLADIRIPVAPSVLYLTMTVFTAGVMWQALFSEDNAADMQNMLMLPVKGREFAAAYLAALGIYTLLTKTAGVLAVILAVSVNGAEILGSILCAVGAMLMTAGIFLLRKYWYAGVVWAVVAIGAVLFLWDRPWFLLTAAVNGIFAFLLLLRADGYDFYLQEGKKNRIQKSYKHGKVWRYLFRYMRAHKNYIMNTAVMWCAACALPFFFRQMGGIMLVPVGFAVVSMNTPVCILLSCDPALEQAVRFLPDGGRRFCAPYCLFIFLCNMAAEGMFLCSFQIQIGGVTGRMIIAAVFFALQSAVGSVLLEWFYPVRGWKIESDLWRHPRKYIVPAVVLATAMLFFNC